MSLHVIGVDPGFADAPTGVALLRCAGQTPQLLDTWTLRARGRDWQARIDDVLAQFIALLATRVRPLAPLGPVGVAYELSYVGQNAQAALRLAQLGGGVRGAALTLGLRVVAVQPSESKRALAGNGAADKDQVIAAAKARFGRRLSEHEADATGHALAGGVNLRAMTIGRKAA